MSISTISPVREDGSMSNAEAPAPVGRPLEGRSPRPKNWRTWTRTSRPATTAPAAGPICGGRACIRR